VEEGREAGEGGEGGEQWRRAGRQGREARREGGAADWLMERMKRGQVGG
jgi:hypothetical protein